ncbi:MAG: hypothetical protein ABIP71_15055, partial [Verrucomicrobiota bacterium]
SVESLARHYIETAILKLPEMPNIPESFINVNVPHGELARNWMDAVLSHDRCRARSLIFGAIDGGIKLTDIYDGVLVPCLRETG